MTEPTGYPIAGAPRFAEVPLAEVRLRRGSRTWPLGMALVKPEGTLTGNGKDEDEDEDEADR